MSDDQLDYLRSKLEVAARLYGDCCGFNSVRQRLLHASGRVILPFLDVLVRAIPVRRVSTSSPNMWAVVGTRKAY